MDYYKYCLNAQSYGKCSDKNMKLIKQMQFLRNIVGKLQTSEERLQTTEKDETDNFDGVDQNPVTCVDDAVLHENITKSISSKEKCTDNTLEKDEDVVFLNSLIPSVKLLTKEHKMLFRMNTIQFLQCLQSLPNPQTLAHP